jgi:triacylglycerol lipase
MTPELRQKIAALGADLTPDMVRGTQAIFAPLCPAMDAATIVTRDISYGPDPQHRLDIFTRAETRLAPVLVYAPGGGFMMAQHRAPNLPFFDNIGEFAARNGLVGATMTYRTAPAHGWPAGRDDIAGAVHWLRENVAQHGGDPERIYVMGQSAGAVHVAGAVAQRRPHVAGAILVSGIYDPASKVMNPFDKAYYGEDPETLAAASLTQGLIDTQVPLLASVSEFDPADFQKQAATLVGAYGAARDTYLRMLWLEGHNHLSPAISVGGSADALGAAILNFIDTTRD